MKAKIELDVMQLVEQALPDMDDKDVNKIAVLVLQRLVGQPQRPQQQTETKKQDVPKTWKDTVRKRAKKTKSEFSKTQKHWKEDKEKLFQKFEQYKGNLTEKRIQHLCKLFKRSKKAIICQLWFWNSKVVPVMPKQKKQEIQTAKPNRHKWSEEARQKQSERAKKITDEAKEIRQKEGISWNEALSKAQKEMKGKGDANTQSKPVGKSPDKDAPAKNVEKAQAMTFPRIFPLSDVGNEAFKSVISSLINGNMSMFTLRDAKYTLNLPESMNWNDTTWEQFLTQVAYNSEQIAQCYRVPNNFRIQFNKGDKVLMYKRG